ncbi:sulfatase-like hydrolase/transferase [Demequina sp. NBRC 110056]|uniref:sulfatase-like hydrolase/transferase n=1 Tax=Demequina sp. NBRC 110056 TaxID=1570345 RepID=UPI0009FE1B73|nr:sulfatase-like hydrolase/transferase [Demequina sp. NBRC 110056]
MSPQPPPPHAPTPGEPADDRAAEASATSPEAAGPQPASETVDVAAPKRRSLGRRILVVTGLVLALPMAVVFGGLGYVLFQVLTNRPDDSPEHEASKNEYLREISEAGVAPASGKAPNVLLVYYDDLGYGDLGFSGDGPIDTPNIDALAESGIVLSNYHAPSPVCTPSRAAMLTGRLAPRADVPDVLFPTGEPMGIMNKVSGVFGLTQAEITIPDVLQASGYETRMIGKWHVGDTEGSLPNDFGFDSFLGSLYSNDINPFEIYRDDEVLLADPVDQTQLDELYTSEAVDFIADASATEDPFFLYFAHNFPHDPLYVSAENEGRSDAGLYGDVVETLDDGIGRIVDELEATGQLDNTVIMVTSDNGPWYLGDPGDHRGRKGSVSEGGQRVPFLVHWPDGLEGGRELSTMTMGTDILPTLLEWLDLPAPDDRQLDGTSMAALLEGTSDVASEHYYFYAGEQLLAVSDGRYKYYAEQPFLHANSGLPVSVATRQGPWLFDLEADQSEAYDVIDSHPDIAADLAAELDRRNQEMADNPRGWS